MQRTSSLPQTQGGDWSADMAMIVAATVEPSCAFAFCFGRLPVAAESWAVAETQCPASTDGPLQVQLK